MYVGGSSITLANTLVAGNTVAAGTGGTGGKGNTASSPGADGSAGNASGPDVHGSVSASDHDLIGNGSGFSATTSNGDLLNVDPNLGPLQDNGGPTQTMLPQPGSPALGAGDPSIAPPTDQRGQPRPTGGPTDIGSAQVTQNPTSPPPSPSPFSSPSPSPSPKPAPSPTLHTPSLLTFFDGLLGGEKEVNDNGTVTVIDRIFGITLFVSTYDSTGDLTSVTLFGINVTFLFG